MVQHNNESNEKNHLKKYGYTHRDSQAERLESLRSVAADYEIQLVIRNLNSLRNKQSDRNVREIYEKDIKYLKDSYQANIYPNQTGGIDDANIPVFAVGGKKYNYDKKSSSSSILPEIDSEIKVSDFIFDLNNKTRRKVHRMKTYKKLDEMIPSAHKHLPNSNPNQMKGGADSSSADTQIELVNLPEENITVVGSESKLDNNVIKNTIYEKHKINNHEIIFYTLTDADIDHVHELDLAYLDSDQSIDMTRKKIKKYATKLIGIKSEEKLQGYGQFEPSGNSEVKIKWFCANKTYGTPLYKFMEKYFFTNNYTKIILSVSLKGSYAVARLNFWNKMGFKTDKIDISSNTIFMSKLI